MKTIKDVDVTQKRVFLRVDFNVPLDAQGQVADDARIRAALPTISYAIEKGAKLIVASHLGRPKGKVVAAYSLKPAAERLSALLNRPVTLLDDCIGGAVTSAIDRMQPRDVVMLENLRFHPEEEKNDDAFAKALAELCDVYVNDAFAVSHRANASVEAMVHHAPVACAGFLLEKEMTYFRMALLDPKRPLVSIVGGAKVSSKIGLLKNLLNKVDKLLIGGAMANTFFRALGYATGKSLVEEDLIATASDVLKAAKDRGIPLYLPVDVVTAPRMEADAPIRHVPVPEIGAEEMALDVGPATGLLFAEALQDAATIVWNGPIGAFEIPTFSRGTLSLVDHVATSTAISIIGGGDTGAAVHLSGKADRMTYISTGGGAFLELLEGKALPGVVALESVS